MREEPRILLERLCIERGEDFSSLSRMLGKNSAYIQQYLRRGTPKRLREEERRTLARYFDISESALGGPGAAVPQDRLLPVMRVPVSASAGPGAIPADEQARPYFAFDQRWLRNMTAAKPDDLAIIRVEGDSMEPTLGDGDDILVDRRDCADRLRDGIYVLRVEEALIVKRLALNPVTRRVTVQSDNPAYPDWPDLKLDSIHCIGRVIWAARRVA
ncbi:MAG: helix-turn-helix transcriptional regulator [Sphingomicrobium sp.]|nr:S24 family peptidase [Sphingomonadales bacterium]